MGRGGRIDKMNSQGTTNHQPRRIPDVARLHQGRGAGSRRLPSVSMGSGRQWPQTSQAIYGPVPLGASAK